MNRGMILCVCKGNDVMASLSGVKRRLMVRCRLGFGELRWWSGLGLYNHNGMMMDGWMGSSNYDRAGALRLGMRMKIRDF